MAHTRSPNPDRSPTSNMTPQPRLTLAIAVPGAYLALRTANMAAHPPPLPCAATHGEKPGEWTELWCIKSEPTLTF